MVYGTDITADCHVNSPCCSGAGGCFYCWNGSWGVVEKRRWLGGVCVMMCVASLCGCVLHVCGGKLFLRGGHVR